MAYILITRLILQFILLVTPIDTALHNFIYTMTNNRRYRSVIRISATTMPNKIFLKYRAPCVQLTLYRVVFNVII